MRGEPFSYKAEMEEQIEAAASVCTLISMNGSNPVGRTRYPGGRFTLARLELRVLAHQEADKIGICQDASPLASYRHTLTTYVYHISIEHESYTEDPSSTKFYRLQLMLF